MQVASRRMQVDSHRTQGAPGRPQWRRLQIKQAE
jgi:hypothetical protein